MSPWEVIRPSGDYRPRQEWARARGARLYLEQHFDAAADPRVDGSLSIVAAGDPESAALGREYAARAAEVCPHRRVVSWGPVQVGGRGAGNVERTRTGCPSALLEPGFVSCPDFDAWAGSDAGLDALAGLIVHVVRGALPGGGVVALSVGHLGRNSRPVDRGAPRVGGGWEADLAAEVVARAARALVDYGRGRA